MNEVRQRIWENAAKHDGILAFFMNKDPEKWPRLLKRLGWFLLFVGVVAFFFFLPVLPTWVIVTVAVIFGRLLLIEAIAEGVEKGIRKAREEE